MALTSEILVRLKATQSGASDFGNDSFAPKMQALLSMTDGTTANKSDLLFVDERAVATGANDDIDLAGVLTDAYGSTITAAEVVAMFIINAPITGTANTTDLTVGNEATNAWEGWCSAAGTVGPIKPGGFFLIGAGDAAGIGTVTAGTGDMLRIANSAGATATYQIAIVARSA